MVRPEAAATGWRGLNAGRAGGGGQGAGSLHGFCLSPTSFMTKLTTSPAGPCPATPHTPLQDLQLLPNTHPGPTHYHQEACFAFLLIQISKLITLCSHSLEK